MRTNFRPSPAPVFTSISRRATSRRCGSDPTTLYTGFYTTDTFNVTPRLAVTAGGRFNIAQIGLTDEIGNDPGLNGSHVYSRFNPTFGATYKVTPNVTVYGDYAEANRAPTPLELGCADPMRPCLIDNALVGDPNLQQVVSHTFEAACAATSTSQTDALQLEPSAPTTRSTSTTSSPSRARFPATSIFRMRGNTLRQGVEADASYKLDRWNVYANFTYVDATFRNALTLSSPNNPFADANGNIFVTPGDHLTGIPDYRFKAGADYQITDALEIRRRPQRHRQSVSGRRRSKPESAGCRPIGW